jgi:flagellar biosynthetic protein FliQ
MSPEMVGSMFSECVYVILLLITVLIIPSLIVGVLVAIFQAATQINEQGLSFVPKLFVTFLVLVYAGPWILKTLVSYTDSLITNIPYFIG